MTRTTTALLVLLAGVSPLTNAADPGQPVISEIVIDAPAAAIWNAWTRETEIEAWMAPSSELELKVGGNWRSSYDEASTLDDDSVIHNEILAFDPERMLALRTVKPPADFPFPDAILDTWSVLYIQPIDAGRTHVVLRMFGFGSDEESQAMREFFEWGNQYELDKLKEYLDSTDH
jgi:uncharacterized protein YndB with AHSA1/START domain